MNKKPATTIRMHLLRGAIFLSLLVLLINVLPPALGQLEPINGNGPSQSTPTPTPCNQPYVITTGTAAIVPGTTDIGNHGDDTVTTIALPFPYTLYDTSFTSINLGANGNAQFVTTDTIFNNVCLPWTTHNYTIFPYWDDLYLVNSGFGIFTSVNGTAPNRIFNIEWRAQYFPGSGSANFELRLYEGQTRFDVIYGTVTNGNTSATAGVQRDDTFFDQYFCNGTGGAATGGQSYILQPCGTPTPTPAPTCPAWLPGPDLPTPLIRAVGVFFPADGNFYSVGGRTSDSAGSDFQHVLRYSPTSNSWTQMGVTLPDNQVNNMACGVLTVSGTPLIYCVGGSAATQTTATARVFLYSPVTDTATTLTAADNWPGDAAGTILPGGFAVVNNKLYLLGGFNINVASTNQIWEFDPTAAMGSRWTQKVNTPEGIMFAPTCSIGGIIYVAGASDYSGGTVVDTTNSFSFNPGTNSIGMIATIPRATGETRALNFNGKMWVIGGGRVAPNPSHEVDIYNPGTNTWTTGLPFTAARRNFPADTDGSTRIWLAGGYGDTGTPVSSMEFFCGGATPKAQNISTRLRVQTGDNVLIGGFIITGSTPKTVAVRGIGPSLGAFGVPDPLADPTLELRASNGTLIMQNDNWQDDPMQAAQLTALGLAPTDTHESALVATLNPNASYTAILAGKNGGTGVGLVEAYDTNSAANSQLANISTRGFVQTGAGVMIGGFILGGNSNAQVALRGIGPSLSQFVNPVLADPTLELHDSNGATLVANDNWQDDPMQATQLVAHGLAPSNLHESGIFASLPPGAFTAILAGKNGGTGIGLVEIYNVQ